MRTLPMDSRCPRFLIREAFWSLFMWVTRMELLDMRRDVFYREEFNKPSCFLGNSNHVHRVLCSLRDRVPGEDGL